MINIENLSVNIGGFTLKNISLTINQGEYFVILGPTGAGKTVLLESIAGLNPIKRGRISVGNREITREKTEKRGVSIVYQDQALFPHMSVRNNILFGLTMQKKATHEKAIILDELAKLLNISDLLGRKPSTLSGGEKQKVALARALSTKPEVLLLDEPLSALDPETRENLRSELQRIHRTFKTTVVHVTHDFSEAMAMADRIAIIGNGELHQVGTPEEIFYKPNSEFVARFTMMRNVLRGEVSQKTDNNVLFHIGNIEFTVAGYREAASYACIRPDDLMISLYGQPTKYANNLSGTITKIVDSGLALQVTVDVPPEFVCLVNRRDLSEMKLVERKLVIISFKPESVHIF